MNFLSILILTIGHPYYKPTVSSILLYLESEASDRGITTRFTCCSVEIEIEGGSAIATSSTGFKLGLLDGTTEGAADEIARVNNGLFLNWRRVSNADPIGFNEVNEVSGTRRLFSVSISSMILF
jgi:hypothetical protein